MLLWQVMSVAPWVGLAWIGCRMMMVLLVVILKRRRLRRRWMRLLSGEGVANAAASHCCRCCCSFVKLLIRSDWQRLLLPLLLLWRHSCLSGHVGFTLSTAGRHRRLCRRLR